MIFMATGSDAGHFVHFPWEDQPRVISEPNGYSDLPIDDVGELHRTVIVKTHGSIDGSEAQYRLPDSLVITEDQHIDYLSRRPVESLMPLQILDKLRSDHSLFLGHTVRDQRLRVLLRRVWDARLPNKSWAVQLDVDNIERDSWMHLGVELLGVDPADYVHELERELIALEGEQANARRAERDRAE